MTQHLLIEFEILSFWRVGTGEGEAAGYDATCAKDDLGLPKIPGKQVRGLFREAVREICEIRGMDGSLVVEMFGSRAIAGQPLLDDTSAGCLRFDDARLRLQERQVLCDHAALIPGLYRNKRSTALLRDKGVAKPHSLRFEEVAIPVTLEATVRQIGAAPEKWDGYLKDAAHLIRAVGSGRSRGLGRAIVLITGAGHE